VDLRMDYKTSNVNFSRYLIKDRPFRVDLRIR
jgi:hypothetical protein